MTGIVNSDVVAVDIEARPFSRSDSTGRRRARRTVRVKVDMSEMRCRV